MSKNIIITLVFVIGFNTAIFSQVRTPALSSSAKIIQTVGLTDIEIQYSRPSTKGRKIFGEDGLIPFDKFWRTGANSATKIIFNDDITIGGKTLKKGAYTILTKPGATSWDIYFYPYETGNWSSYVEKKPIAIITSNNQKMVDNVETFTISLENISMTSALLTIKWENTKVSIPIGVQIHEKVMKSIKTVLNGPSDNDYFQAALYMHEAKVDLEKALMYIQKVTNGNTPRFFHVYREALILTDLDRKTEAITSAKKSLELSKKAGNEDFVRLNQKLIKQLSN